MGYARLGQWEFEDIDIAPADVLNVSDMFSTVAPAATDISVISPAIQTSFNWGGLATGLLAPIMSTAGSVLVSQALAPGSSAQRTTTQQAPAPFAATTTQQRVSAVGGINTTTLLLGVAALAGVALILFLLMRKK